MSTVLDLGCEAPLECRATLVSRHAPADVHARLVATYADRVRLEGDLISVRLVEPLELITTAREATSLDNFELRAFAAARDALDMLRDPVEPTLSSWTWVCDQLALELDDAVRSFVAGAQAGYLELDDDFLVRPILVVDTGTERNLFDQDAVSISLVELDRDPTGWFVRRYRSRERPRGYTRDDGQLYVNGLLVDDGHPLQSGDQIAFRNGYSTTDLTIVAIL